MAIDAFNKLVAPSASDPSLTPVDKSVRRREASRRSDEARTPSFTMSPDKQLSFGHQLQKAGEASRRADAPQRSLDVLKQVAARQRPAVQRNPVVNLLTGKLDRMRPAEIPQVVTKNPFVTKAMSEPHMANFMNRPAPIGQIAEELGLPDSFLQEAEAFGIDLTQEITPLELFAALGVDPQRIGIELKLLQDNLRIDGVASYMARARTMQAPDDVPASSEKTEPKGQDPALAGALAEYNFMARIVTPIVTQPANAEPIANPPGGQPLHDGRPDAFLLAPAASLDPAANFASSRLLADATSPREVLAAETPMGAPLELARLPSSMKLPSEALSMAATSAQQPNNEADVARWHAATFDGFQALGDRLATADVIHFVSAVSTEEASSPLAEDAVASREPLLAPWRAAMADDRDLRTIAPELTSDTRAAAILPDEVGLRREDGPAAEPRARADAAIDSFAARSFQQLAAHVGKNPAAVQTLPSGEGGPAQLAQNTSAQDGPAPEKQASSPPIAASWMGPWTPSQAAPSAVSTSATASKSPHLVDASALASLLVVPERQDSASGHMRGGEQGFDGREFARDVEALARGEGQEAGSPVASWSDRFASALARPRAPEAKDAAFALQNALPGGESDAVSRAAMFRQIMDRLTLIARDRGGQAHVDMTLPGLGSVELAMQMNDDKVDLRIMAGSEQARDILAAEITKLRDMMAGQNLQLDRVDVGVAQSGRDPMGGSMHSGQDRSPEQRFADSRRSFEGQQRTGRPMATSSAAAAARTLASPAYAGHRQLVNQDGRIALRA